MTCVQIMIIYNVFSVSLRHSADKSNCVPVWQHRTMLTHYNFPTLNWGMQSSLHNKVG